MGDPLADYMLAHERIHAAHVVEFHDHQMLPAHITLEPRVRALEDFTLQAKTLAMMLKVIFGASILAAVTGVLSILMMLDHLN